MFGLQEFLSSICEESWHLEDQQAPSWGPVERRTSRADQNRWSSGKRLWHLKPLVASFLGGAQVATKIGLLVYWPVLFRSQVRQVAMKNRNADIASEQKELL